MSRRDYDAALSAALDRFAVPAPAPDLVERIVARSIAPTPPPPPRRDRRGRWALVRRAVVGTVAAGAISAAAVASGLLQRAWIEVPVLSAMLAPAPVPTVKAKAPARPVHVAAKPAAPAAPVAAEADEAAEPAPTPRTVLAEGRARLRDERRAFVEANPQVRPLIRDAVQREIAFVRAHPEVRELRRMPPAERRAYLAERPELRDAIRRRGEERRALLRDNPELADHLRAQTAKRIEMWRAAREARAARAASAQAEGNSDAVRNEGGNGIASEPGPINEE